MEPPYMSTTKSQYSLYEEMKNDEVVLMGNHISDKVHGKGSVDLEFTYGKKLTLKNVFYVLEIRKNLRIIVFVDAFSYSPIMCL